MLLADGLVKQYGQLRVLKNVSLQISSGDFVAVSGPSGAGKSTLLQLLGGLDIPDAGTVSVMGENLFKLSAKKQNHFRNRNIGFVFQFHNLLPEFTALENVAMPLWIGGKNDKEAKLEASKMLEVVGLKHRLQHKPGQLSGGEQQRVAIARAIVTRPSIILADEPTGNLDTANAQSVHELFLQLRKDYGLTFLVVTHNECLAALADKVLVMKDGEIIEEKINKKIDETPS